MTMNTELPLLLSRDEAARMLNLSTKSLDLLLGDGRLPVTKLGRRTLVHRRHLEEFAALGIVGSIRTR